MRIEEVNDPVRLQIKQLKLKTKKLPSENTFGFTEYLEIEKEENEIDLGLFLELAEKNKIIYSQVPLNTVIEGMEKLKNGFLATGYFSLCEEEEIETNRFFEIIVTRQNS